MKLNKTILLFVILFLATQIVQAQTTQDTSTISIETRNLGNISGKLISESSDSIKINTKDFGILSVAKSEIIIQNLVSVETVDGNNFMGEIIKEDPLSIVLKTQSLGIITISRSNIRSLKEIDNSIIKDGVLWFENPQATRYFWAPNGFGLKKGEGYYQNIYVLWNQFAYGVTDNFSIGGGVIPLFLFSAGITPVFITPKFSIPIQKDKINIGGGALIGTVLGESGTSFGIVYGLTTFGTRDNNVSLSLGYGFAGEEWAQSPLINISGMFRLSSRFYFLTENYFINIGGEGIGEIGLGGRWIINKAALDFIFAIPVVPDMGTFIAIPLIGFTIPFGNN
jgi:hypothetical protein